nr:PhzF family phenazine biosynthesis isomerase [Allomuricauda sp.]
MGSLRFFLIDTFIGNELKGNPTPVCLLERQIETRKMESMAKEFNCPVSVFLNKEETTNTYQIRYFTITGEIPACGHGTLAAAYVLFRESHNSEPISFRTLENTILIASHENGTDFIQYPKLEKSEVKSNPKINGALGIKTFKSYFICSELESLFIELEKEEEISEVNPNYERLLQSTDIIKEIVVMSESEDKEYDFTLRSFCPWIGVNEDPVTGSIHAVLGHFWKNKLGKEVLIVKQASERGGRLIVKPLDSHVKIGGSCKIIEERIPVN